MKLWAARNKSKVIKLFTIEPEYNNISDEWKGYDFEEIELNVLNFLEVTFENSPQEVELKLKNTSSTSESIVNEFMDTLNFTYDKSEKCMVAKIHNADLSSLKNIIDSRLE